LTLASAVAIAAIGVTAAWAVIGDGGLVRTCFSKSQGTWRPIDSAASCKAGETQLDFYSKAGADAAFAAAGSSYTKSQSDSRYLGINAKAADSDKLDGLNSTDFVRPLWAVVNSDGTLARGSGVVSVSKVDYDGTIGSYEVIFNRDVSGCAYSGTLGGTNPDGEFSFGEITVHPRNNNVNGVFIFTLDDSGTRADRYFQVAVIC
jgi:hypothetical protein